MNNLAKRHIRPILYQALRKFALTIIPQSKPSIEWIGSYPSWVSALAECSGYDTEVIIDKLIRTTAQVADGKAVYERDGVLFDEIEYSWPLLASLLYVYSQCQSLRVIDIGGSLGSTFRQNVRFFDGITELNWTILEQPALVDVGKRRFSTDRLHFIHKLTPASLDSYDVALFGSSLCYLEDPFDYLDMITNSSIKFLIIERTPFLSPNHDHSIHRIAKQICHNDLYEENYPCRIFSSKLLLSYLNDAWELKEKWLNDLQPAENPVHYGYLFQKAGI